MAFLGASVDPITFAELQGCDLIGNPDNPPVPCLARQLNTAFFDAGASDAGMTLTANNLFRAPLRAVAADGLLDPRVTLIQARKPRVATVLDLAAGVETPAVMSGNYPIGGVVLEARARLGTVIPVNVRTTRFGISEDGSSILSYRLGLTAVTTGEPFVSDDAVVFPGTDVLIPAAREIGFVSDFNGFAVDVDGDGVINAADRVTFSGEIPLGGLAAFRYRHPTPQALAGSGVAFDTITVREAGKAPIASIVLPLVDAVAPIVLQAQRRFDVGDGPTALVAARINADASLDLGVANGDDATVSILLGTGTGGFTGGAPVAVGTGPVGIAAGDVTNDDPTDLVTANAGGGASLLMGAGDGTISAVSALTAGTAPSAVALADLDGDGLVDALVANSGGDDVSVILDLPTGTPAESRLSGVGDAPSALGVGRFDGDAFIDLAVANELSGDVAVFLGNGDGSFRTVARPGVGVAPVALAIGDVDGDGLADLVVANGGSSDLSVLLGNGDGTFEAERRVSLARVPAAVALADLNGDDLLDVITADPQQDEVSARPNLGGAFFGDPTRFAVGDGPIALAVGDFNGDGAADVVAANAGSGDVSVLLSGFAEASASASVVPDAVEGGLGALVPWSSR